MEKGVMRILDGRLLQDKYDGIKLSSCDLVVVVDLKNKDQARDLIESLRMLEESLPDK